MLMENCGSLKSNNLSFCPPFLQEYCHWSLCVILHCFKKFVKYFFKIISDIFLSIVTLKLCSHEFFNP